MPSNTKLHRSLGLVLCCFLVQAFDPIFSATLVSLSFDGRWIAYVDRDSLWLQPTTGKGAERIADFYDGHVALPQWSPKGDRLAFYSSNSGDLQLWVFDIASHKARQVSFVAGGINPPKVAYLGGSGSTELRYSWSPDGSRIAFATQVAKQSQVVGATNQDSFPSSERLQAGEPLILTNSTPEAWTLHGVVSYGHVTSLTHNGDTKTSAITPSIQADQLTQVFVLDIDRRKLIQLTHGDSGYFTPAWSPDGRRIAYMSSDGFIPDRNTRETNIFVLNLASGEHNKITQGETQKTLPLWSPDGKYIAFYGRDIRGTSIRKEDGVFVVRADGRSEARNVASGIDRVIIHFEWSPGGEDIVMTYRDGLMSPLVSSNVRSLEKKLLSPAESVVGRTGPGFTSNRAGIVWAQQTDPNGATTLWVEMHGDKRAVAEIVPAADLAHERRYEVKHWSNSRGETLDGMLVYPIHYQAGRKYPLVIDTYGVGTMSLRNSKYDDLAYVKAAEKYFVFRSNHRAPHMWRNPLKDPAYTSAAVGPNGIAVMVDDVLSGVDSLTREGLIDPDRICLAGFSNGGLQAEQILTQTSRFKCAVLQSPATSNVLTGVFLGYPEDDIRWMYGIAPWQDPTIYTALVPLFHADKITTPILLAAGDRDDLIIPTIEMYKVLRYLNKDVILLRYTDQGHGFTGAAAIDFTQRARDFLGSHLDNQLEGAVSRP